MSWSLDGRPLSRVLVSRLRYLGDVVMSTVVIEQLKRGDPDLHVGYLCEQAHASVLEGVPAVDRLHAFTPRRSGSDQRARPVVKGEGTSNARGWFGTVLDLRRASYDLAVDLFFNPRSAWMLRCSGTPARITGRRNRRARLYTHVAEQTPDPDFDRLAHGGLGSHLSRLRPLVHEPSGLSFRDWFVGEGRPAVPRMDASPKAELAAREALAAAGFGPGPFVALAPAATWAAKSWPAERWRGLVDRLNGGGVPTLMISPPAPDPALAAALEGAPGLVLPPLPLETVFGIVARARGLVAVDGGVMHAAVALGCPTVGLFGPTDPDLWFPYEGLGPHAVLATRPHCHPCDLHECSDWICMPGLEVDDVVSALTSLMIGGEAS